MGNSQQKFARPKWRLLCLLGEGGGEWERWLHMRECVVHVVCVPCLWESEACEECVVDGACVPLTQECVDFWISKFLLGLIRNFPRKLSFCDLNFVGRAPSTHVDSFVARKVLPKFRVHASKSPVKSDSRQQSAANASNVVTSTRHVRSSGDSYGNREVFARTPQTMSSPSRNGRNRVQHSLKRDWTNRGAHRR